LLLRHSPKGSNGSRISAIRDFRSGFLAGMPMLLRGIDWTPAVAGDVRHLTSCAAELFRDAVAASAESGVVVAWTGDDAAVGLPAMADRCLSPTRRGT
jgi:hypothetical protein